MVDIATARQMALSLAGAEEKDHFGIPSFRVKNKIFSTMLELEQKMMVKLTPFDQSVFKSFDPEVFYPVPNKWGEKGATVVELSKVTSEMLEDALNTAWRGVTSRKL